MTSQTRTRSPRRRILVLPVHESVDEADRIVGLGIIINRFGKSNACERSVPDRYAVANSIKFPEPEESPT